MKRPRKGATSQPAARHPRKKPTITAILAERGIILATLAGIPKRDRRDVEQQVLIGAWNAIRRGLYRPDPTDEPRKALRKWLHGIAWRQASHYFGSAWVQRAVLHAQPLGLLREPVGIDLHAQIEAREVLEALTELPDWQVDALLSVDDPESLVAYAKRRGMNPSTAASRLRIAREALALKIRRWRR
ncbi:sigma-70 family RNA polymerase sigma factor [Sorangium sp. So ce590]|uniref:RNA polymerase sigma factor n=1 Tax=Sorangium sp. So ce590 TaxID=3133317 RepID=UPI003F5F521E